MNLLTDSSMTSTPIWTLLSWTIIINDASRQHRRYEAIGYPRSLRLHLEVVRMTVFFRISQPPCEPRQKTICRACLVSEGTLEPYLAAWVWAVRDESKRRD